MEEKPISIELPNNIECTIETTDAAIKNQTASSSYKPAILRLWYKNKCSSIY